MAKNSSTAVYPLSALRATVLHTQFLTGSNALSSPTPDAITKLVTALGYLQIDTLHVVNRAHYVTLWARLGSYPLDSLHKLAYSPDRRLYEGWGHAASFIPLEHYRYHRWRTDHKLSYNPVFRDWLSKQDNRALAARTLDRIRAEGPLRVSEFESEGTGRGVWYDWKPSKMALEALFAHGDLMVADRVNFHRVYDVRERVLPKWVHTTPVDAEEGCRFCLEQAARALGVFDLRNLTFYAYLRATPARALIRSMVDEGVILPIRGESLKGVRTWMIHRDNLSLLERAAAGKIKTELTTFLAPFDSIFWAPGRDELLWNFKQLLECYKPAAARVYGYFCFPILHRDKLIGRFDPKLDRKSGVLHLNAIYLEPGIKPEDELVKSVAAAMGNFLAWHGAKRLKIQKSRPIAFGKKLLGAA